MGRTATRFRPRSPPPHYSILNPSDRLIVQHPSPASIRTQSGPSSRPPRQRLSTNVNPHTTTQKKPKKRRALSLRSAKIFRRPRKQISHQLTHQPSRHHKRTSFFSLQHPRPTPAPTPRHSPRKPSHPSIERCAQCHERRCTFEFPARTPTKKCRHCIRTCSYCLHECIRHARQERRRGVVRCPDCGERMCEVDVRRGVLVWMERPAN